MDDKNQVFLVMVTVQLLGGKEVVAVDAFDTRTRAEAKHWAMNTFLQAGDKAVVYGGIAFLPETVGSVAPVVLGRVDISDSENKRWHDEIMRARQQQQRISEMLASEPEEDEATQRR